MDLNYLLHRQQVERSRAKSASTDAARQAHEELARGYERKIELWTGDNFEFSTPEGARAG